MKTDQLISIETFCISHNIDVSFINSLQQSGLIEVIPVKETTFIPVNQLTELEKFVRLHYELDINLEGMEAVIHLLQRVKDMQHEIITLRNRLSLYESNE